MKKQNPFFISSRNRRGIFYVLAIALVIVFTPRILSIFSQTEEFEITQSDIQYLERNAKKKTQNFKSNYSKKRMFKRPRRKFDPNTFSAAEWMELGLSQKQANVVLKFTKKKIYSNEQLERIFVIPSELYELIKDSTFYPEKEFTDHKVAEDRTEKKKILIELNAANQEELESIPGIGAFFAKNIIKQRDRLGGFVHKEQVLEVWKMDIDKYNAIEPFIKVDRTLIKKIELNSITAEELKSHPYLNWSIANSIVKMRSQKNGFKTIEEIKESVLIDEELFEKLKPYLSL